MATAGQAHHHPWRANSTPVKTPTVMSASTDESRALPRMASDPDFKPTKDLAPTTIRLATRRPRNTRRTRAVSGRPSPPGRASGMGCKLVSGAVLVNGPEQHSLEIPGLRDVEELGVVPPGAREREQLEPPSCVPGGGGEHLRKHRTVDVVRAGAGEKHSPGGE